MTKLDTVLVVQFAPNGNLKLQEIRSCRCHFLQNQLFHRPRFAVPRFFTDDQLILCTGVALSNSAAINQPVACTVTVLKDEAAWKATLHDIGAKPPSVKMVNFCVPLKK